MAHQLGRGAGPGCPGTFRSSQEGGGRPWTKVGPIPLRKTKKLLPAAERPWLFERKSLNSKVVIISWVSSSSLLQNR